MVDTGRPSLPDPLREETPDSLFHFPREAPTAISELGAGSMIAGLS